MMKDAKLLSLPDDALAWLRRPERILISGETAEELTARAAGLAEKIRAADDRLVVGLVGGTGVGKSTLINALAGQKISTATELRPTTNRLVLYRHRENTFSLVEDEEVHQHESSALRRISLADFPDFDSIEPHHRQALAGLFPKLDLLLWVVDPVKYADQALFHWLSLAPQAKVNSLFVFNKIDEYERRYGAQAAAVAEEVVHDFSAKLSRYAQLEAPDVLALSALAALNGDKNNSVPGFQSLLERIEHLKEKKLRLSIKELNLRAMTRALVFDIETAAALEQTLAGRERLKAGLDQGERELEAIIQTETGRVTTILRRSWRTGLTAAARDRAPWPLDFYLYIWDRLTGLFSRRGKDQPEATALPQPNLAVLSRRMVALQAEAVAAFGAGETDPGRVLGARLAQRPTPEETTAAGAETLVAAGFEQSKKLAKRYRWRIRHHLIPVLILVYPFLPLIAAWLGPLISGRPADAAPAIEVSLGWRDMLPLLEIILGLYLLETIYYGYSLDRAAGRTLERMVGEWKDNLGQTIGSNLIVPIREFVRDLDAEIEKVRTLVNSVSGED